MLRNAGVTRSLREARSQRGVGIGMGWPRGHRDPRFFGGDGSGGAWAFGKGGAAGCGYLQPGEAAEAARDVESVIRVLWVLAHKR